MAQQNTLEKLKLNSKSLFTNVIIGGVIGTTIISLLVFSVKNPPAEWGEYWQVRPLIITPLAAAFGGFAFYLIRFVFTQNRWSKMLAVLSGVLVFLFCLWLGTILGLDGTLWN